MSQLDSVLALLDNANLSCETRLLGTTVRSAVSRMRREQGNDLFNLASKRSGAHAQIICADVEGIWQYVMLIGDVEALPTYSNLSAMYFQQKK